MNIADTEPDLWVQFWTEDPGSQMAMYISVMFVIAICGTIFNFAALWYVLLMCKRNTIDNP